MRGASTLVAAVALASCSGLHEVSQEGVGLDDSVASFYLSPQTYNFGSPSYLILVSSDGSTRAIRTSGMDNAQPIWTQAGLYFYDTNFDYFLNDSMHRRANPKANRQDAALVTANGAVVSLFNEGADDEGYHEHVIVAQGEASAGVDVLGYTQTIAACGERVFAVAELSGREFTRLAEARDVTKGDADQFPQMLTQLYPQNDSGQKLIAVEASGEVNPPVGIVAPCQDDIISYLTWRSSSQGDSLIIRQWNTLTGKSTERAVVDADGAPLRIGIDVFGAATISPMLDSRGRVVWFAGNGVMYGTDPTAGRTDVMWNSGLLNDATHQTAVAFQGEKVFLLEQPNDDQSRPLTLYGRDVQTGEGGVILTIQGINQLRSVSLVLRGLAVAPG